MGDKSLRTEPNAKTDALAHAVIGGAIEVHRALGSGFLEEVYARALALELRSRGIAFEPEKSIRVNYKGQVVGEGKLDLLVGACLIVELKAVQTLAPIHTAQVIAYLKATGLTLGLLINFNVVRLRDGIRRIVLSPDNDA